MRRSCANGNRLRASLTALAPRGLSRVRLLSHYQTTTLYVNLIQVQLDLDCVCVLEDVGFLCGEGQDVRSGIQESPF